MTGVGSGTEGRREQVRILYHGLIPEEGGGAAYWASRRRHVAEVTDGAVTVQWRALEAEHYRQLTPAELARHEVGEAVASLSIARSVAAADPATYDAVVIGIVQDTGLDLVRTLVDKPVVGYGQAAMLLSRCVAHRAGLLVFNPDLAPLVGERLDRYVPGHLVATELVDLTYDEVLGVFDGDGGAADHVRRSIESACTRLAGAGAEVVIPGQMLLSEAVHAMGMASVEGMPVVDGIAASFWLARAAIGTWACGLRPPAGGFHWARPPDALRRLLLEGGR
ncbi:MAG: aspartate/glutamate racemase family protein [Acidimicrobiales bacterium]